MPKSMGELVSELFSAAGSEKNLAKELESSGNKFIVDMFKDVEKGIVTPEEAVKNKDLFNRFSVAMRDLYGADVSSDLEGINQLKDLYITKLKKKETALYKEVPIDIRFSSKGIGKRGLQTEIMESVFSNIAGTGFGKTSESTTTIRDRLSQDVYKGLLGDMSTAGDLSKYSSALGYSGAGATQAEIEKRLFEKYSTGKTKKEDIEKAKLDAMRDAAIEAQAVYYSTIKDEFDNERKSLVGGKFVQIVEEPGLTEGWSRKQIERKEKGTRLNLPAFSAYATVFGQDSSLIKEFRKEIENIGLEAKEAFEYIKALQIGVKSSADLTEKVMSNIKEVPLGAINRYEESIGYLGADLVERHPTQDLRGSLYDVDRFPEAFKTKIPRTKGEGYEDFYVPSGAARGVYPDELIAGAYGPKDIGRRLQHVLNMAQDVEVLKRQQGDENISFMVAESAAPALVNKYITPIQAEITKAVDTFKKESGLATGTQLPAAQLQPIVVKTLNKIEPQI